MVTNGYNDRMLLNSVIGANTYVSSTTHDAAGRIDVRAFGNNTQTNYDYYPWTQQGGRLQYLKSGISGNLTSLQNLTYTYDTVGNISSILDSLAGLQTQSFTYDELDRLTSAVVSGGTNGLYNESYGYNTATGNLETKGNLTLQYNDASHAHAVSSAGSNTYQYDANGNQTRRTINGQNFNLGYDAENRLVSVSVGGMGYSPSPVLADTLSQRERARVRGNGGELQGKGHPVSYHPQPVLQSGFPSTPVLDNFNRANGGIGSSWSGSTSAFSISSNKLQATTGSWDNQIYWGNAPFGANQEAYVTVSQVNSDSWELSLMLKSQSNTSYGNGTIEVFYQANSDTLQIWTSDSTNEWVQYGADITSLTLSAGDQLGVRSLSNGMLEVYKNSSLLATQDLSGWQFVDDPGYIGVWFANASGHQLDDFGGGNVSGGPTPTITSTPAFTPTATNTPAPLNSGWVNPSANVAATGGDGNGFQTSPTNVYTDNATFAEDTNSGTNTNTSCSNTGKDRHVFYTYNLSSVPGGSTILGVEVRLDMRVDSTSGAPMSCIELSWDGGTTWTAPKTTTTFTTSEASYTLGGTADTWGHGWSTSELSNLRVRITNVAANTSRDFSLDWVPVQIYYTLPAATATFTPTATNTPTPTNTPTHTPTATSTATQPPPFSGATFVYDGDGNRVAQTINGVTTYFIGAHYEVTGATVVTKYYFAGAQRVAMRTNGMLYYLFTDHLGSTSITTDASGNLVSEMRYKAWGEVRYSSGTTSTKYQYTSQYSYMDEFELMYYNARFYSPYINQFLQPDTIVPDPYNPQDWNRYAYARYNPLKYTDPSGHRVACDADEDCKLAQQLSHRSGKNYWKTAIKGDFGIKMVDGGEKWSEDNLATAYLALGIINATLNGGLKTMVGGTTFTLKGGGHEYKGVTSQTGVVFYVSSASYDLPLTNFLHETGHLIDYVPATKDVFSNPLRPATTHPSWVDSAGYVDSTLVMKKLKEPIQAKPMHEHDDANEYWADAFANYVAGNIDVEQSAGRDMYNYVHDALQPYIIP